MEFITGQYFILADDKNAGLIKFYIHIKQKYPLTKAVYSNLKQFVRLAGGIS